MNKIAAMHFALFAFNALMVINFAIAHRNDWATWAATIAAVCLYNGLSELNKE